MSVSKSQLGLFLLLSLPILAWGEALDGKMRDLHLKMMAKNLQEIESLEQEVQKLPALSQVAMLMSSSSDLADRLPKFAKMKISAGELTQSGYYYIFGTALTRLAHLASTVNQPLAAKCHLREARIMYDLSEGKPGSAANCRAAAYAETPLSRVIGSLDAQSLDRVDNISTTWSQKVIMLGLDTAELDNRK